MAGSIASVVVGRLLGYLAQSAVGKIATYLGGNGKLKQLEQTMMMIQARLLDAERLSEGEDGALVKLWLKRLKHVLYRLEDLFEEVAMVDKRNGEMAAMKLCKLVCFFIIKLDRLNMNKMATKEVEAIMGELEGLTSDMHKLHLRVHSIEEQRAFNLINGRETHSFVLEEDVIGRDEDKNELVRMLLAQDHADENVSVIPIVGMGGLGKTTLAQLAYNDRYIQQHFELKYWACISEITSFQELAGKVLKSIITAVEYQKYSMDQIQSRLREAVNDKRYLLVLDDVWDEDRERWICLRSLLCGGKQGSKIIVTSRSKVVALNMGTVEPYELKGLKDDKSWALFKSLAFREGQEEGNPNLSSIGKEIVKKCVNVPLAIRTIAGILYSKDTEEEWVHFKDSEIGQLEQKENNIMSTLKLSYDHLPPQLKQCFAYCSLFPKDYEFDKERLIYLWMSQGFVESFDQFQSPDDVGHRYFMELLRRCFFQDVGRTWYGRIRSCKMHDLIHDLACMVADECLMVVMPIKPVHDNNIKHVCFELENVVTSGWKAPSWLLAAQQVRSLICDTQRMRECSIINMNKIFSGMRSLRALDFGYAHYESLPKTIGELKHLRYLRISVFSSYLPDGITRLQNLQTLNLRFSNNLRELPRGFNKLINLRHLQLTCYLRDGSAPGILTDGGRLIDMPPRFRELKSLQELDKFIVGKNNGLDALGSLNLRGSLRVYYRKCRPNAISEAMVANLKGKNLTALLFNWSHLDADEITTEAEELLKCLQPPQTLKVLIVQEWKGVRFPSWGMDEFPCLLYNLVSLHIEGCRNCQHLPIFSRLPHLKFLDIRHLPVLEYIEEEGEASSNACDVATSSSAPALACFPSIEKLSLISLPQLKGWSRVDGTTDHHHSLPSLRNLCISDCAKLMSVPLLPRLGLLVTHLERLTVRNCNELDLWDVMDNDDGGGMDSSVRSSPWQSLTNLRVLMLFNIWKLESLPKGISCLTALQELHIENMPNLKSLPQWIGQLTQLHELHIYKCSNLSAFPESIGGITSLKALSIRGCPELARRYQKPNGEGWRLIQHIPDVCFW